MAASPTTAAAPLPHVQLMDRMYRLQRYFYDITRKYYLFGRDRLIAQMPVAPGDRVLEMGCGTGRNLVLLARKHPRAQFFGVDAANVMIDTAQGKVARNNLQHNIVLRQGLAENLDAAAWFNIPTFDRIFFSYSLSMIPTWPDAIEAALKNLAPGGEIWVVDFWDQAGYPKPFAKLLTLWLSLFHVHHRPELLAHLEKLAAEHRGTLTLDPIGSRYAYLARFVKA
jgi:S-adenosylmethionine-diacylgycerolhomoserine-N-methlytransferase